MVGYLIIPICSVVLAIGCSLIGFVQVNLTLPKLLLFGGLRTKLSHTILYC
jgi:hypothetical protein